MLRSQLLDGQRQTATENVTIITLHKEANVREAKLKTATAEVEALRAQSQHLEREANRARDDARDLTHQLQVGAIQFYLGMT